MSNKNLAFNVPALIFPCGEPVGLPLPALAQLRSAGVKQLEFEDCWNCHREHILDLPDLSVMVVTVQSELIVSPLSKGG